MKTQTEEKRDRALRFTQQRGELLATLLDVYERGERAGLNMQVGNLKEGIRVAQFAFEASLHNWLKADRRVRDERKQPEAA